MIQGREMDFFTSDMNIHISVPYHPPSCQRLKKQLHSNITRKLDIMQTLQKRTMVMKQYGHMRHQFDEALHK